MQRLEGKVAIITGAGQGIGLGIAQAYADSGASLVISGRDINKLQSAASELSSRGAKVHAIAGDVRKRACAQATVAAAIAEFGKIDVLINNAQSAVAGVALEQIDDDAISMTIESGLLGTLYHMQAAFPHMKERGGSIINFGSRQGIYGGVGSGIYAATKEAIRGLSRTAAREWGRYKIRVNVVCPAALSPAAVTYLAENPKEAEMFKSQLSLGYFGDAFQDVAPIILFLGSEASHYLTGQTLNADGGQQML
jgi:NAD(P)-dependent dehydrogenase (short-subunit alcohol dehydrogenase family)